MNNRVFIIAEAGVNHNGNIDIAKQMIDKAKDAGVDAVKFQTFKAENLVTSSAKQAKYQVRNLNEESSQLEMLKSLELSYEMHIELIKYCKKKEMMFLSSPFDIESIDFLESLGIEIFKIPSGEIENVPYLRRIGKAGKKVILSTGMSDLYDIEFAINILRDAGTKDIIVLHCNTDYPTKMKDVNLNAMNQIKNEFKLEVGYSDHTNGIEVAIAAVALGARVIEKHFTLDKNMDGPDHKASLEPDELKEMVRSIRNIEIALGDGVKRKTDIEIENSKVARKSIVANTDIKKGEVFTDNNIIIKRPGTGISPKRWDEFIGRRSDKDYRKDDLISC